jgi:uncharacterized membrane-anchored protein
VKDARSDEPKNRVESMPAITKTQISKVPQITLVFWVIKIFATTLGETAGDAVSMSMELGYLLSSLLFFTIFCTAVVVQLSSQKFNAGIYWATIIATTTLGTTLADFADRSLGIGYAGGAMLLFSLLLATLYIWFRTTGSVAVTTLNSVRSEGFYWLTIMFSQTLGTALGDWVADTEGLGYAASAVMFSTLLAITTLAYYCTQISRIFLFWIAFILTRPLGAVVGDLLDKPISEGGLELSRYSASAVLMFVIVFLVVVFKQNPGSKQH